MVQTSASFAAMIAMTSLPMCEGVGLRGVGQPRDASRPKSAPRELSHHPGLIKDTTPVGLREAMYGRRRATKKTKSSKSAASSGSTSTSTSTSTDTVISIDSRDEVPIVQQFLELTESRAPFFFGDLSVVNPVLGIEISAGLSVRLIAVTGQPVTYANGDTSREKWHEQMDAAGIVPLQDGGYVYVSNAEVGDGDGGVYGLYFDDDGNVLKYKALLEGTTDNCGGGLTPWNTWISCEEYDDGQCWQVDPDPAGPNHGKPKETKLGGSGGKYESAAVDNRIPERPVFFVTEDRSEGALRRVEVEGFGWESLHDDVDTSYLLILDDSNFEWTDDEDDARESAEEYFPNAEGICFHEEEGKLIFMSKELRRMLVLDLESMTYEHEETGKKFYGEGSFTAEPDQSIMGPRNKHVYFTEDGGATPGVYARLGSTGEYSTLFQGYAEEYDEDETVGIALSPDGMKFYAGIQDAGLLFEFTRDDGLPFE